MNDCLELGGRESVSPLLTFYREQFICRCHQSKVCPHPPPDIGGLVLITHGLTWTENNYFSVEDRLSSLFLPSLSPTWTAGIYLRGLRLPVSQGWRGVNYELLHLCVHWQSTGTSTKDQALARQNIYMTPLFRELMSGFVPSLESCLLQNPPKILSCRS